METKPKLRRVEKDILIPRYAEYRINHELCREENKLFADCAKESGFRVVIDCRDVLKTFEKCSNKWFNDQQFMKEVEDEYIRKREHYRKTGEAEKSPFSKRIG